MSAKLYFRYGAMGSGKSAALLVAAYNYKERGMNVKIFNYRLDRRFGEGTVASRIGLASDSHPYDNEVTPFYDAIIDDHKKVDAIFVDEAQFLTTNQVQLLHHISANLNIPVMCYGLRTDFMGNLFEGSAALMAHAESLEELKTICHCGKKATHVARFQDGVKQSTGDQVQIGDTEYKSMCYKCFIKEDCGCK